MRHVNISTIDVLFLYARVEVGGVVAGNYQPVGLPVLLPNGYVRVALDAGL